MKQSTMNRDVVSSVWIVPRAQQAYSARQSREAEEYIAAWIVEPIKDDFKKQLKQIASLKASAFELEENLRLQKRMHERYRELTRSGLAEKSWVKENERLKARVEGLTGLLSEASECVCDHDEYARETYANGARGWCSDCSEYIRTDESLTLGQRIRDALKGGEG